MNKNLLYRNIPKVDILLENIKIQELIETYGRETVVETIREALESLRAYIKECDAEENALERINSLVSDIEKKVISINTPDIRSVIMVREQFCIRIWGVLQSARNICSM